MAIASLKKLSFCGVLADKSRVLAALQTIGGSHLIALQQQRTEDNSTLDSTLAENAVLALKYLHGCAKKRHQVVNPQGFDFALIVKNTLTLQKEIRNLTDERDAILKRIAEIEPWGNFELPDKHLLGGLHLWFYIVPQRLLSKIPRTDIVWQVVYRDNLTCYVVVIAADEPAAGVMPVPRTHTGTRSLATLRNRLIYAELKLEDKQAERESLTRWIGLISLQLAQAQEQSVLHAAHAQTLDQAGLFALQAWVEASEVQKYVDFAAQQQLALLIEDPAAGELPPTLLKNTPAISGAEDLISFYQLPNYYSWDPSAVVFWSFALFFAIILSDAGYAALFGGYLALKWRSLQQGAGARLCRLLMVTILFSMLWGVLIGSYFGYIVPEHSTLGRFKLLDLENFDLMMTISIAIGTLHLTLSNLIMAYQQRAQSKSLASLGWALLTLGGFGLWQTQTLALEALRYLSVSLLALGALGVLGFSGHNPIHTPLDAGKRILEGLHSLTDVTKIFGNTLSYMRLFALGLAGASLALTFNNLALQVYHALPGLGLLCSILILVLGHSLNIVLCLLSGVLHGLRLNFIEFFNWSLTDEGYAFKAFSKKPSAEPANKPSRNA